MDYTLLIITLVFAAFDWFVVWKEWRFLEYLFKGAVMVLLTVWFVQVTGMQQQAPWFVAGLIFSIAGGIFFMLPRYPFVLGVFCFLLAQLCFASGFTPTFPPVTIWSFTILIIVAVVGYLLYRRIITGETLVKNSPGLRSGVTAYAIAISLMVLSAALTLVRPEWDKTPALVATLGAVLFYISDAILALDRFVAPIRHGRLYNMITYFLGQILLVLGVALQIN
jgi:uncharacterized membrane protein YhhN